MPVPSWDWLTSTPEEQGMDSTKLDEMMEYIDELDLPIDSVIVVRHGYIVLEEYANPKYGPDTLHLLYSVTKSVTSALIGIAIEEGFIESVDQKVVDFFPERSIKNLDSQKQNMTLEHLLTMTTGFEWNASDPTMPYTTVQMESSSDPVQFVLDRPMATDPGGEWVYNNGASHLLSAIITKTTGYTTLEFAREFLFGPLGISNVKWDLNRDPQGIYCGFHGLELTPRDMAKFGYLYLNNGTWNGKQIVPAEYVARSSETSFLFWENEGYGYQWWTFPQSGVYYASGMYGQRIFVVPDLDTVVVLTADLRKGAPGSGLLHRFIIPACTGEVPPNSRYSRHGFSFDYPIGMVISELPKGMLLGKVQGLLSGNLFAEEIDVIWDTSESAPELESFLDEVFAWAEEMAGEETEYLREPLVTSVKDDQEMVYQYFNVTERGVPRTGIMGSWYCDEAERVYVLAYVTISDLATQQDLLREFQRYLDSFVCH